MAGVGRTAKAVIEPPSSTRPLTTPTQAVPSVAAQDLGQELQLRPACTGNPHFWCRPDCGHRPAAYKVGVRRSLIDSGNTIGQNAYGCLATAIILPIALVVAPLAALFSRPLNRTPEEVVRYLRDFVDGTGGDWDFDDFTSIPIADPRLESIRDRASRVQEPITEESGEKLRSLLAEAEAIAEAERPPLS